MSEVQILGCRAGDVFEDSASVALFAEYERECANPLLGATAPNRAQYEAIEKAGCGFCFGARVDGQLVGFAFYVAGSVPHYTSLSLATVISLFVARGARATGLGDRLEDVVEADARNRGCAAILITAPVGSRLARRLFLSPDKYCNTNHVFARRLR